MSILESITLALTSLRSNKMRSMLTLLGVIIGIASVITILTLGQALKTQTLKGLDDLGASDYNVTVQPRAATPEEEEEYLYSPPTVDSPDALIDFERIQKIKDHFPGRVTGVSISGDSGGTATLTRPGEVSTARASLTPVNTDYMTMKRIEVSHGRTLTDDDVDNDRTVAVVSPNTVEQLFGGDAQAALGSDITAQTDSGTADFTIVGVYKKANGGALLGSDSTSYIYVPYPAEARLSTEASAGVASSSISVRADAHQDQAQFKQDLHDFLDTMYADDPDYRAKVGDFKKELESFNKIISTMSLAISAIGGISLLVGGIGVMNIMLITVTERTREIGVRKALGATRRDIRVQFVVEAIIVCMIGGLIGIALGAALGMIGSTLLGTFVFPPLGGIVLSLLFSLIIGLFFGYYPAGKAARLNPIEALRYK